MEVIKASLDRFEGDFAVAYADDDSNRKFDIPREMFESDIKAGARLLIHLDGGAIMHVELNDEATGDAKGRIKRKYRRIREGHHLG